MNNTDYDFRNETGTWQTGRTEPPKARTGLIALLLVLVILLCGIATALSIMNFKLYWQLNVQETTPMVAFSRSDEPTQPTEVPHETDTTLQSPLGISGTIIPRVYQRYYHLPNGLYVTQVDTESQAFTKGIVVGDIITRINDVVIEDALVLGVFAQTVAPGDTVTLSLYRNGTLHTIEMIWGEQTYE